MPEFEAFSFEELVASTELIKTALEKCKGKSDEEKSRLLKETVRGCVKVDKEITLSGDSFSVRSSSCVEDSADNSFAGQFDTFLNVSRSDIPSRIADCVCSLYNENVLAYMEKRVWI